MTILAANIKSSICALFEVHLDEGGVQRVVTPIEYAGTSDRIVVRIRPQSDGSYRLDENGEAAFYAGMADGDIDSEAAKRWKEDLPRCGRVEIDDEETLFLMEHNEKLIAPSLFRVAEAAQQLYAIATARTDRRASDFKDRLSAAVSEISKDLGLSHQSDVELPIAGGMLADHVINAPTPLIIVAATGSTRLLEAEVIHMQYRLQKTRGFVLAVVENQTVVGKKQFERANYYTGKTVIYDDNNFRSFVTSLDS